jgi:hypothetical protein
MLLPWGFPCRVAPDWQSGDSNQRDATNSHKSPLRHKFGFSSRLADVNLQAM